MSIAEEEPILNNNSAEDLEEDLEEEEEEELLVPTALNTVKLFGKWSFDDVEVRDISLTDYIACNGAHAVFLPHTAGRYQKKRFRKSSCPIVERLVCCLMRKGRNSGKKLMAVRNKCVSYGIGSIRKKKVF